MTGTPDRKRTVSRKIKDHNDNINLLWRKRGRGLRIQTTGRSIGSGRQSIPVSSDNFIRKDGDTVMGALGWNVNTIIISTDAIDIAVDDNIQLGRPLPTVFLQPESGTTDDLITINGAKFMQQELWIRGVNDTVTITVKNSGNIRTHDGADFDIVGKKYYKFIYDIADEKWVQATTQGTGGGGISFPVTPPIDDRSDTWTGTQDIDLSQTDAHITKIILDQNLTLTFSNPPTTGTQVEFEVELTQDGTGGFSVTWPASVVNAPTISTNADTKSIVVLRTNDGGITYYAMISINGSPGSGNFASKQLDNLVSPVVNTELSMGTNKITNLVNPTSDQDAATKVYVDSGFATQELDNLGTTSVNANIIPQSGKLLGSAGNEWSSTFSNNYKMGTAGVTDVTLNQISGVSTGMELNVPASKLYDFQVAGVSKATISAAGLLSSIALQVTGTALSLNDATSYAGINGDIYREGSDVKIFTGGSELNMSSLVAGASTELDNLGTTSVNANIIPQSGKLLGSAGNEWSSVFSNNIKFGTAGVIDVTISQLAGVSTGLELNVPASKTYDFQVAGVSKAVLSSAGLFSSVALQVTGTALSLNDATSYAGINGDLYREGSDVKIFSASAERNVSKFPEIDQTQTWTADQTFTADVLSDGLNDLGTTANPWNNIVSDNTLFCSNLKVFDSDADINVFNDLDMQAGDTVDFADNSSSASAGGQTLPSNPVGFIVIKVNGTSRKVPFYAS